MTLLNLKHSPSSLTSKQYQTVNSENLVQLMESQGFNLVTATKKNLNKPADPTLSPLFDALPLDTKVMRLDRYNARLERYNARLGHEQHFLRFSAYDLKTPGHNLFFRISNSYDGSSSLKISLDILRLVCLNGMIVPRSIFEESITHKNKDINNSVIDAVYKIVAKKEALDQQIEKMSSKVLNFDEKLDLVDNMFRFRFPDSELQLSQSGKIALLKPIRHEEKTDSLYQNFNTLQEKFTKGSKIFLVDENGNEIGRKVREVKSIVTADNFNDQSWNYALKLA